MILQVIFVAPFAIIMLLGGPDPGSGAAVASKAIGALIGVISLGIALVAIMVLLQKKSQSEDIT